MKLQAILLSALVGLSQAANLRFATNGNADPTTVNVQAYLSIQGLQGPATEQDATVVHDKLRDALDDMTEMVGYYCPWWSKQCTQRCAHLTVWQSCTENDPNTHWSGYHWDPYAWHWDCRVTDRCHYDDDFYRKINNPPTLLGDGEEAAHSIFLHGSMTLAVEVIPMIQAGSKKHIEHKMCAALRKSGVDNLKDATDCKFSLLEAPSLEGSCNAHGPIAADITIYNDGGSDLADLEDDEIALMKDTITDVYNKAFLASGKGMKSFAVNGWFSNEDATEVVVRGQFEPLCPNDNNPTDKTAEPMDFQAALCDGFKNSGIPVFEHIRTCEFLQALGDVDEATNYAVQA